MPTARLGEGEEAAAWGTPPSVPVAPGAMNPPSWAMAQDQGPEEVGDRGPLERPAQLLAPDPLLAVEVRGDAYRAALPADGKLPLEQLLVARRENDLAADPVQAHHDAPPAGGSLHGAVPGGTGISP